MRLLPQSWREMMGQTRGEDWNREAAGDTKDTEARIQGQRRGEGNELREASRMAARVGRWACMQREGTW